jgi:hypothetical protein
MPFDISALDEAWAFVEEQLEKKVKKKDVVPLMNEAGFRTLKGKLWTYQTLLLEQRRRNGARVSKDKQQKKVTPAEMKGSDPSVLGLGPESSKKKSTRTPRENTGALSSKKAEGLTIKPKVKRAKPKGECERNKVFRDEEKLNISIDLDNLEQSVRVALDANHSMEGIAKALGILGALDQKARPWTAVSLNHHMSEYWMKSSGDQSDFSGEIEIRGGLADFVDREQKKALKQKVVSQLPSIDEAWDLIQSEVKKGTKKKAIVGLLNMGGFTTRRGKPWTYQNLLQEFQKRNLTETEQLESNGESIVEQQGDRFTELKLRSASFEGDGLAGARSWIQAVLLPKLRQSNCKTSSGRDWDYELLLWELLRRDLDLEKMLSTGLDRWWAPKDEDKKEELESLDLFEILE